MPLYDLVLELIGEIASRLGIEELMEMKAPTPEF